jgi:Secretion system C-terminal sorting domain
LLVFLLYPGNFNSYADQNLREVSPPSTNNPVIEFTFVPAFGSSKNLKGRVRNVNTKNFKVAVYIFVEGAGWWIKPRFTQALTTIQPDSTWSVDITTGGNDRFTTRIRAFLVHDGFNPPLANGLDLLPDALNKVAAATVDTRRNPRFIKFSGYQWWVKNEMKLTNPGNNFFSDHNENVWVDAEDNLHLKIVKRNDNWFCSEVILTESLGYGRYSFEISTNLSEINENAVLGLFSWDNDAINKNNNEIDIEFSRWGNIQDSMNAQYVVQPSNIPGNIKRWKASNTGSSSTHRINWTSESINFLSFNNNRKVETLSSNINSWSYVGPNIPNRARETIRINLWLFDSQPPSNEDEVEIVITDFKFSPFAPTVRVESKENVISSYALMQNYPNPFNPTTFIKYQIPELSFITIKVFDIAGKEVKTLLSEVSPAGSFEVEFKANELPSGIYFYYLEAGDFIEIRKMVLLQ